MEETAEEGEGVRLGLVDLRDPRFYDRNLLRRFYDELMLPAFGQFEDELESFESWVEQLEVPAPKDYPTDPAVLLHILLVLRLPSPTQVGSGVPLTWREEEPTEGRWWEKVEEVEIAGGTACEYYPESNCGLLTYTITHPGWQRRGIGNLMTRHVLQTLQRDALAVFLETNNPDHVSSKDDVMDPLLRHRVLQRLGWWILDYDYVQPALSEQQQNCRTLRMAVHHSFLQTDGGNGVEKGKGDEEGAEGKPSRKGVKGEVVLGFLREFFTCLKGERALATDPDYLAMQAHLSVCPFILTTL